MNCRKCGTELPAGAMFCAECGATVAAPKLVEPQTRTRPGDTAIIPPLDLSVSPPEFLEPDFGRARATRPAAATPEPGASAPGTSAPVAVEPVVPAPAPAPVEPVASEPVVPVPVVPVAAEPVVAEPAQPDPVVAEQPAAVHVETTPARRQVHPSVVPPAPVDRAPLVPPVSMPPVPVAPAPRVPSPVIPSLQSPPAEPRVAPVPPPAQASPAPVAPAPSTPPTVRIAAPARVVAPAPAPVVDPSPAAASLFESQHDDVEATRIVRNRQGDRFVLQFSTGENSTVFGSGLIGRNPVVQPGEYVDQLVTIVDSGKSVSKTHLEFGQTAGAFWIVDRFSANGTVVRQPDARPQRLDPGKRQVVARGTRVDIGEQFFVVS